LAKGDRLLVSEPGDRWSACKVAADPEYSASGEQWTYVVTDGTSTGRVTDGDLELGDARRA
jgi:hypothetical protein